MSNETGQEQEHEMTRLDQLDVALDQGLVVTGIFLHNKWSYRNVILIERTNVSHIYLVSYDYRGTEKTAAVSGYDVASVTTTKPTQQQQEETE